MSDWAAQVAIGLALLGLLIVLAALIYLMPGVLAVRRRVLRLKLYQSEQQKLITEQLARLTSSKAEIRRGLRSWQSIVYWWNHPLTQILLVSSRAIPSLLRRRATR
ncbi:MAG: hypothetical protein ACREN8_10605 [Candidatus Dormibacteraceae bacterium]